MYMYICPSSPQINNKYFRMQRQSVTRIYHIYIYVVWNAKIKNLTTILILRHWKIYNGFRRNLILSALYLPQERPLELKK